MKNNPALGSSWFRRDVLGVDLGSHTVKVLQLRSSGKKVAVLDFAQRAVWPLLAGRNTEGERQEVYIKVLRDILGSNEFRSRDAAIAFSGNSVLVRFVGLSTTYKRGSKTELPDEAKALIPFDVSEAEINTRVLEASASAPRELMLVAAEKKTLAKHIEIAKKAGLKPEMLVHDPLALETAYALLHGFDPSETIVLANIGAATTSLAIVEYGVLRAVRILNIAGDAFTRAIERDFGGSPAEAEDLKHEYGLLGHDMKAPDMPEGRAGGEKDAGVRIYSETAVRIHKLLKPAVKELSSQIRRTIDSFMDKRPDDQTPVARIVLAGGCADMKCLPEVLLSEVGLPVEVFRPLADATRGGAAVGIGRGSAALAVVTGLALSNASSKDYFQPPINLLPKEARRAVVGRRLWSAVSPAVLFLCLAGAIGAAYIQGGRMIAGRMSEYERQLASVKPRPKSQPATPPVAPAVTLKPKPKPKRAVSPYAYLADLRVSGIIGDMVMLVNGRSNFVMKGGRLLDEDGTQVTGVSAAQAGDKVVLTTQKGEEFVVRLPR